MRQTRILERNWVRRVNQARTALGAAPIDSMPKGVIRHPRDCAQHRAMRGLGLGHFEVWNDQLLVDRQFAEIIARAWGTKVETTEQGTGPMLPAECVAAIREFDTEKDSMLSHLQLARS